MTATLHGGVRTWGGKRDSDGHRTFTVSHLVRTSDYNDGPYTVMFCTGLPAIGSEWNFGNDFDLWAFCYPDMDINIHQEKEGDPVRYWKVDQKFSTKPLRRCQDTNIEDPLQEPIKISGTFVRDKRRKEQNYDGSVICNSSWEKMTGPNTEFDHSNPTVTIEMNSATLGLPVFSQMINTLNDDTLWGLPTRCIKLSNAPWSRKLFGTCSFYFTRTFEFDIDYNTFDRDILDEGTRVLRGHWQGSDTPGTSDDADVWIIEAGVSSSNPNNFIRFKDRHGENCRVILDGHGQPWSNPTGTSTRYGTIHVAPYTTSNFLLLGIPTDLETGV